jgi:hypothetical protein
MSTALQVIHTGAVVMNQSKQLKPELQEIVNDLLALKAMAKDGILTHHSQRELVKGLSPRDMADVARTVFEAEKRQQPIYNKCR